MGQVAYFYLKDFIKKDYEYLQSRSTLLKLKKVCAFRIDEDFNPDYLMDFKLLLKFLKDRKKVNLLSVRDATFHKQILDLLDHVDLLKIKYEFIENAKSLLELLVKARKLQLPVMIYIKADNESIFRELYNSLESYHGELIEVADIEKLSPVKVVEIVNNHNIYLLDCPICVANKLGVGTCTSGILDLYLRVRKVGRKIIFEEIKQTDQVKFFKKSRFCEKCICGCKCLGSRLNNLTPNITTRNAGMYSIVSNLLMEKLKE